MNIKAGSGGILAHPIIRSTWPDYPSRRRGKDIRMNHHTLTALEEVTK